MWDVVHRRVPLRPCPATCSCLHCKDKDAWLDVAESLKLTDEQKCKTMVSRYTASYCSAACNGNNALQALRVVTVFLLCNLHAYAVEPL